MSNNQRPDIKGPRFRKNVITTLNIDMFTEFINKFPKYKDLEYKEFKEIIMHHSEEIWKTVITTRDGIKLPEHLGMLFGATCINDGNNYKTYYSYHNDDGAVARKNWESDGALAKIFYTNYTQKGTMKDYSMWGFTPIRQFKRTFSAEFKNNWKTYVTIGRRDNVSALISNRTKPFVFSELKEQDISTYNEFEF